MCQVQSGEPVLTKATVKVSNVCAKCEEKAIIVVGTNGTFCRECFLKYFSHKFRASMGKNPVVRHGDKVLVAFSGGIHSSALLRLIQEGTSPDAPRKLKFNVGVIFVDETAVNNDGGLEESNSKVKQILSNCGFPNYIVEIEDIFDFENDVNPLFEHEESLGPGSNVEKLKNLLESTKTLSSKMELVSRLRTSLLSLQGRKLGYDHIFLGETSSRIAVNILSNVALGRGVHIPQDSGFTTGKQMENGVDLLRPLRDISSKEVAVYNMIHKVETVFVPNLSTSESPMSSIQRLTENFMKNLVAGYPATETTVYRTSNKIQANRSRNTDNGSNTGAKSCLICCGIIDTDVKCGHVSAVADTILSQAVSVGNCARSENNLEQFENVNFVASQNHLCYACSVMSKEMNKPINEMWPKVN